nr:ensconsin-like isoform X7 [Paramormyrops kingsleyae]
MAEGATLKEMRAQMAAAAQAEADERRSQAASSPVSASTVGTPAGAKPPGARPVLDGASLKIDDKLRVAKERREEQERQQAARGSQIEERERKTKLQYERQLEERQRKMGEQRQREEQRRVAVEEKRRQKLEEEKEHYEAVVRRTLERSQRLELRQKRWSWGGGLTADGPQKSGDSEAAGPAPLASIAPPSEPQGPQKTQVDKRSSSTVNLKQSADSGISKRLSSSSAALINSPDKKRRPLDSGVLSRLLTPTQASLARSKSAAVLLADGTDPQASVSPMPRGPIRSRSVDRQKGPPTSTPLDTTPDSTKKVQKQTPPSGGGRPPSPSPSRSLSRRRSPSPVAMASAAARRSPSPVVSRQNPSPPSPLRAAQGLPSPQLTSKPAPIQRPPLTPVGPPTLRKRDSKPKETPPKQPIAVKSPEPPATGGTPSAKTKDDPNSKAVGGTTSAEEAAKILSENRRLAREQKEKEEQLRLQREQEERRLQEEQEARRVEEERVRRLEEEQKREEERKRQEEQEKEWKRTEEERLLMEQQEKERLEEEDREKQLEMQKEREEAEARALEEAEKQRQERERVMQQSQQERMERKKRIEEIMKRTRKADQNDKREEEEEEKVLQNENGEEECEHVCEQSQTPSTERDIPQEVGSPGSVNGVLELENKENQEQQEVLGLAPKTRPTEGPNFLNGKAATWTFEEFIDLGMNDGQSQNLVDPEGGPQAPRAAFEDKPLHQGQAIGALSEI